MKKTSFKKFMIFMIVVLALASCTRSPKAPEGYEHHNSLSHNYIIDYKEGLCDVKISEKSGNNSYISIADKEGTFLVEVLALRAGDEERYKFPYYQTIDSVYAGNLKSLEENKSFWTDEIVRKYALSDEIEMTTRSIYGGDVVYVISSKYYENGKAGAEEIVDSFRSSKTGGAVNFLKRKIYTLMGDNWFTTILNVVIFSLGFTLIFWLGIICIVHSMENNILVAILLFILFMVAFGYIAVHDEFMGYLYGHNSLGKLLLSYLLLFLGD